MSARALSQAALCGLILALAFSAAYALTQDELVAKLQAEGYSQIHDVKSTAKGISVKATKDGKDTSLVVDSSGQVKDRR